MMANPLHWISRDYGRTKEPIAEPAVNPLPTELPAMLAELEKAFDHNPHWTGDGPITRPLVLMARIVAELARRELK